MPVACKLKLETQNSDSIAIRCEGLSKQYRIGEQERYKALRDVITDAATAPFRRLHSAMNGNGSATRNSKPETRNLIWALDDVSFDVKRGEVIGIIGRNGAGKSTLLKILSRITKPTRGYAEIHGRVGSLLEVGTGFHPELTGRENIYLNAAILGMRKAEVERKFDEIVAFAEIEKFIDTPVKRYSSGMYVRLAFAVAAHMQTEVLLVDEVLAVGDAEFQKKCLGKMNDVSKQGRTVIFVSHNMNAIEELCGSAILLDQGKLVKSDNRVREVVNAYLFGLKGSTQSNEWTNPGTEILNSWFNPLRFALTDGCGNLLSMPVRNDAEIWVRIEGIVQQPDPAMNIGYALYNEDNDLLYWSLSTDGPESNWPKLKCGKCLLSSRIPMRFLNEGNYRLEMIISLHHRAWIAQPTVNAPSIILEIRGGLSDSPYWVMRRPGALGVELTWLIAPNNLGAS